MKTDLSPNSSAVCQSEIHRIAHTLS